MARSKSPRVELSDEDREFLLGITRTGAHPAQEVRRARILLELDENAAAETGVPSHETVAARAGVCTDTVVKVTKAYMDRGGDVRAAITRAKRVLPAVPAKTTGEIEARLIALACTEPPEGHARWSLRLLEKPVILTEGLPPLEHSTIGRVLKRRNFNLT